MFGELPPQTCEMQGTPRSNLVKAVKASLGVRKIDFVRFQGDPIGKAIAAEREEEEEAAVVTLPTAPWR